ncbi:MAG: ribosomal protein S18-alanine N-acetyltransferase [Deltaproteobacteria bacterium]|jgi:ribosomal-protein-alanine N-acetyltransferase|nr:ribosomal protein S18-alanine N-acetyltransferase [Deltaproteobacteria bacterium]
MAQGTEHAQEYKFRILTEEYLDSVLELEKAAFSTPWTREQYSLLLKSGACKLFGAVSGKTVLAYAAVSMARAAGELEIYNIAVNADKRRFGIGKKLVKTILDAASAVNIFRAVLEVRVSNTAALALYESLGFKPAGKRRNYYSEPEEDALIFVYEWE